MNEDILQKELVKANAYLRGKDPIQIIEWALRQSERPILTTNFGPYSASLVHAVNSVNRNIKVIWCDTGYNTPHTYRFANDLINRFDLNMHIYSPRLTAGFRDITTGIPHIDTEEHKTFTEEVKLEPFRRALKEHNPDVWFTNLRQDQSDFRSTLDILHLDKNGILKVSPFFYYTEFQMELYLQEFALPNEKKYYDPTKVLAKRECGLHL
ncbi:MAG: phosphoadenosine phosphosulfate reductase family protein [Flavobacteriaceae bacterium]|nr:MAG: phosphoadenosine phosphosulfate reductase family protein [Flavobacteriaceae bacterium]